MIWETEIKWVRDSEIGLVNNLIKSDEIPSFPGLTICKSSEIEITSNIICL